MKNLNHYLPYLWMFSILLLCSANSQSQNDFSEEAKIKTVALEIINSAATCSLITIDGEGFPTARMMQTLPTEGDFLIWLATKPNTKKIDQIKQNAKVSLYYTDDQSTGYVCLKGKAVLIDDAQAKKTHWKEGWQAFYPNPEVDMILIKIIPISMEVVSYSQGIISIEEDWSAKRVLF